MVCSFIRNYVQIRGEDDICYPCEGMEGIDLLQVRVLLYSALDSSKCWVWRTGRFTARARVALAVGQGARRDSGPSGDFGENFISYRDS